MSLSSSRCCSRGCSYQNKRIYNDYSRDSGGGGSTKEKNIAEDKQRTKKVVYEDRLAH